MTIVGHIGPEGGGETLDALSTEELVARRLGLHKQVGHDADELNRAHLNYHATVVAILAVNEVLRIRGVDTTALITAIESTGPRQDIAS